MVVSHAKRPRFPDPLLIRTRCPDTFSKIVWMKEQHGGTDTPVHRPEKTAGYSYSSTSACHPVNNSRGKRRSIPAHKTRPDSPLPTMQGCCDQNQKWIGTLKFLPPLEMRPSSISANPVESREVLPNSTVSLTSQRNPENPPEVTGTSRGNPGILAKTRERS